MVVKANVVPIDFSDEVPGQEGRKSRLLGLGCRI